MRDDSVRQLLSDLPTRPVPVEVRTKLRVIASHERDRRLGRFQSFERWALHFNNFLKPLAVPAAGGLLSSVFLFTALAHTLNIRQYVLNDVPLNIYTQVSVDALSPFGAVGADVIVEVTIDERGQVADYAVANGRVSQAQLRQIGNLLLFSTFTPATAYGQPVPGKILVVLHHIDVRG